MPKVRFVFVGEGSSDTGLVSLLEDLCVRCGADEVAGVAPDLRVLPRPPGNAVSEKARAALSLEPTANLLFIQRDADSRDPGPRYEEIERETENLPRNIAIVPIVPVQELEAWLLLDEAAIRLVSNNPRGRQQLDLPAANEIENIADPKARLADILVKASAARGGRLAKFRQAFPRHRQRLLEMLSADGTIQNVRSWQRMVHDLKEALQETLEDH